MNSLLSTITRTNGCKQAFFSCSHLRQPFVQRNILPPSSFSSSSPFHASSFSSNVTTPEVTHTKQEQPTRRRRKRRIKNVDDNVPSYKEFVHKFTVVTLYRDFLKAVNLMPHNRDELIQQVKMEFRANQHDPDPFRVQRALADGKRHYQELQEMTGYKKKVDSDSWLNTKDPEDPRGRVGEGWPWMK